MVVWKSPAWVTSAVTDDSVLAALVLAESIRKTKTSFRITVLTCMNVSTENRNALKESFDIVILLEESNAPKELFTGCWATAFAKAYTFDLMHFTEVVYIPLNSMFLENADHLFQPNNHKFQWLGAEPDVASLFSVQPDKNTWKKIWCETGAKGKCITEPWLCDWLKNQKAALNAGVMLGNFLANFSVSQGKLLRENLHSPIVHFVTDKPLETGFVLEMEKVARLKALDLGVHELLIVNMWLETAHAVASAGMAQMKENDNVSSETEQELLNIEPIAIVGMSCRYPGANSLQEFWKLLFDGDEAIREPPTYRWTKEHTIRVCQQDRKSQAGFLSTAVDEFDARFFGVSPKEAAYMDPQTRLLHEVLWESLEDAGINPLSLYGSHTGIFTGSWMNDYKDIVASSAEKDFFRTYMGNSIGAAAARLSFLLGLTGPSIATESGCSSAIVALDLAVKSLRNGETNLALAGGVNLLLHAFNSSIMEFVISPNGRCKTFDANADGFGRAEGCGVLVLKRMSDALKDRDHIWALIRGSAVSQEGVSRSLGTPTVHCESLAMKLALEDAHVSPERVSFVETHGTGTSVGDPMEVAAIAKAYYSPLRQQPLIIGSVKTNVGHTESCSGITGIMKAVLALQHQLIPKHRNLETLNPEIFLDSIPAQIPLETVPWPKVTGQPRICGVSSFGITGTDGHVIIQEAPDYQMPKFTLGMERPLHLIKISGKSQEALDELLMRYKNQFEEMSSTSTAGFANHAYSANVGRASFNHRAIMLAANYQEAVKVIEANNLVHGQIKDGYKPQVCFLFTGQGSQYPGMAKTLYDTSPIFRINFDACDRTLRESYNLSIKQVLWESESNTKELSRTIYSQTSIFCIEYCLLKLWQSWGIKPDYVLGHSLGEFAAAVAAEVLTFEDALKLVAERSRLVDNLPRGSMLVIKASKPEVEEHLAAAKIELDFAAVNSPEQTVVAGDTTKIQELLTYLKGGGVKAIILEATHAFHSRHMDPMLEQYRKIASTINYNTGNSSVQYVSGMEGRILDHPELGAADYWVRHTREKVSFTEACTVLKQAGVETFLEVGPQPVLSSFVMLNNEGAPLHCFPSLRKGTSDWETILTSLGKLFLLGHQVDWEGYDQPYLRQKVSLPFHPFFRKSFWVECSADNTSILHPLIGYNLRNASALNIFQNDLVLKAAPYLKDHCIGNRIVFPGAGFAEMCLSAGYCVANGITQELEQPCRAIALENVRIDAPLELKEGKSCRFQVLVDLPTTGQPDANPSSGFRVQVFHQNNLSSSENPGKWVLHASSIFVPVASTKECMAIWQANRIPELMARCSPTSPDQFYKTVDSHGLRFGDNFRMIQRYWQEKQVGPAGVLEVDEVVVEVELPNDWNKYLLHPLIIDAIFQTGILSRYRYEEPRLKVPVRVGKIIRLAGPEVENLQTTPTLFLHCWWESGKCRLFISTPNGTPLVYAEDVEMVDTNVRAIESVLEQQTSAVSDAWEELWKPIPAPFCNEVEVPVDVDLIHSQLSVDNTCKEDDVDLYKKTNSLLFNYILNALRQLSWNPEVGEEFTTSNFCEKLGIHATFHKLINFYFYVMEREAGIASWIEANGSWRIKALPGNLKIVQERIQELEKELEASKVKTVTEIYKRIAQSLSKILSGKESALNLLFPQEPHLQHLSAENYYQVYPGREALTAVCDAILRPIIGSSFQLNQHKPGVVFRVLEVGSGTGSMSMVFLQRFREIWGGAFEFYFTDISQSFFVKAEKRLEEFSGNVKYAVFNIEQSPLSQGIPLEYFDLVVATDVLHATRNLEETLIHLRQTLRPEGVLCFTETLTATTDISFVFGLLEGYWRFEDLHRRPYHCCVDHQGWSAVLQESGFKSVHCVPAHVGQLGCVYAVADGDARVDMLQVPVAKDPVSKKEWVLFGNQENAELTANLGNMLEASGYKVTVLLDYKSTKLANRELLKSGIVYRQVCVDSNNFAEINSIIGRDSVCGVVYGWGLSSVEHQQSRVALPLLQIAQALVGMVKPANLYILTSGVHPVTEDSMVLNPTPATLFGMAKSLKNENPDTFVRYVDLDQGTSWNEKARQVLYELTQSKGLKEQLRLQVAYRGNMRYEPKLVKANFHSAQQDLKLPPSTEKYHLKLPDSKLIQDLEFEPLELEGTLGEEQIEVKTKAYALNFRDIFAILKPSKQFEGLNAVGLDFAGVVTRVGGESRFKVGDRVFGANFRHALLPSHLTIEASAMLPIPDWMTYAEATTLPAVFLTAYHCLINVAKMSKGDTVLIHTASGGVGLAAIQLAKQVGATIITTAGNPRKRAYLKGLGIQHVFRSRDTSYEQDILRVTGGKGVDVVLNSITGPGVKEATLRATAKNGRFVEMSKLSTWSVEEVKVLRPDVDYSIVDLTTLDKGVCSQLLDKMEELLREGKVSTIPYVKFDALALRQALQYFQKARHIGKVVVTMPEVSMEQGHFSTKVCLFNAESSYLITGGLGGIGFEVCKWMLGLGATNVVLTGRSAPKPEVEQQILAFREKGFNVSVKLGDIGSEIYCKRMIEEISSSGKPLRGVMHCAGVLRDNLYANQTWSNFEATFNPKVVGTWNLHRATQNCPLEHFVVYSSLTALLGTPGQPNHASANCFEDAFIHYRHSLGLPGTSINWGQWAQVGCAKDASLSGVLPVSVNRMLAGLELALRTEKRQVCLSEFDSFPNMTILCPLFKGYLDDRLWKQCAGNSGAPGMSSNLNADQFWREMDAAEDKTGKTEVMTGYLKTILRNALRLEPDEPLSETANLQELGVDSLMMIELKNSIQSLIGSSVGLTAGLLKNCNTLRLLAEGVVNKIVEGEGSGVEDEAEPLEPLPQDALRKLLENDSVLPQEIGVGTDLEAAVRPSCIKTVLVTGATGQLGRHTVAQLSSCWSNVSKIYCLARGDAEKARNSLQTLDNVQLEKVSIILGDVSQQKLGLSPETYENISGEVDAVIHCAAKSHPSEHLRVYPETGKRRDCRSVNLGGTLNALRFACHKKVKHVFYPSSLVIGALSQHSQEVLSDIWPNPCEIDTLIHNRIPGQQTCKWLGEVLLKQANERGIPCKVFRFSWMAGESGSGQVALENAYIQRFLSYLVAGAMPAVTIPGNFLPVDICAEMSLRLFFDDRTPSEVFNLGHPKPDLEQEFVSVAKELFDRNVRILEQPEFMQRLEELVNEPGSQLQGQLQELKRVNQYLAEAASLGTGYVNYPDTFFANSKVSRFLPDYGKDLPTTMEFLKRDLCYLKNNGFLTQFGF